MGRECRSGERLFYWVLVVFALAATSIARVWAAGPGLTTISEVRSSDAAWGADNDRNLAGRFTSRSFTLPRLSRVQDYFLRRYDGGSPPKYSRFSAGVHVDWPL